MNKKILLFLVLLLCFTSLAFADVEGDWTYDVIVDGGGPGVNTATITAYNGVPDVVIPTTLGGLDVTLVTGTTFLSDIETVVVPATMPVIQTGAFGPAHTKLTEVTFLGNYTQPSDVFSYQNSAVQVVNYPDAVITSIPDRTFAGMPSLTTLNIPNQVITSIGEDSFQDSTIPSQVNSWMAGGLITNYGETAFLGATFLDPLLSIDGTNITVGSSLFLSAQGLTHIRFEDSASFTSIDGSMFNSYVGDLSELYVGSTFGDVGSYTFSTNDPWNVTDFSFTGNITTGDKIFAELNIINPVLTGTFGVGISIPFDDVVFNNNVTYLLNGQNIAGVLEATTINGDLIVERSSFGDRGMVHATVTGDVIVNVPMTILESEGPSDMGPNSFNQFSASTLTFNAPVLVDSAYAFYDITGVTSITFNDTFDYVDGINMTGPGVFQGAVDLVNLTYTSPSRVLKNMWSGCTSLENVDLIGVTTIGDSAFVGTNISTLVLPSTITSLGEYAFSSSSLTTIDIPSSITALEVGVFSGTPSLTSVVINSGSATVHLGAFESSGLTVTGFTGSPAETFATMHSLTFIPFTGQINYTNWDLTNGVSLGSSTVGSLPTGVEATITPSAIVGFLPSGPLSFSFTPVEGNLVGTVTFNYVEKTGSFDVTYVLDDDNSVLNVPLNDTGLALDTEKTYSPVAIPGYKVINPSSVNFTPTEALWTGAHEFRYVHVGSVTVTYLKDSDGTTLSASDINNEVTIDVPGTYNAKTIAGYVVKKVDVGGLIAEDTTTVILTPTSSNKTHTIEFRYIPVTTSNGGGSSSGKTLVIDPLPNIIVIEIDLNAGFYKKDSVLKYFDVKPQVISGRTVVPVRFIAEELGYKVDWAGETETVSINKGVVGKDNYKLIELVIGKLSPGLDVPPIVSHGRTLVPLRFIGESFGCDVVWVKETNRVVITQYN